MERGSAYSRYNFAESSNDRFEVSFQTSTLESVIKFYKIERAIVSPGAKKSIKSSFLYSSRATFLENMV